MTKTTLFLSIVLLTLVACSAETSPEKADEADNPQFSSPEAGLVHKDYQALTTRQAQLWSRSCALCHVDGNAGAPILGSIEQWASAQQKTEQTLLTSVIDGINDMPPLGYCMACEKEDFVALINFMMPSRRSGGAQ